jgi:hypothetical protein
LASAWSSSRSQLAAHSGFAFELKAEHASIRAKALLSGRAYYKAAGRRVAQSAY